MEPRIVSIHQPAYLPWPGYFHKIAVSDVFVVLNTVQFEKNSFINRNQIKSAQGSQWLTMPVRTKGRFGDLVIRDVEIASPGWGRKHRAAIGQSYSHAAHFQELFPRFEEFYESEWRRLDELCRAMLDRFLQILDIRTPIVYASDFDFSGSKDDLVLEICQEFEATTYLSGALGRNYLTPERFHQAGIEVVFQEYTCPEYRQLHGSFVPCLSTLDMLLNLGAEESCQTLLSGGSSRAEILPCT